MSYEVALTPGEARAADLSRQRGRAWSLTVERLTPLCRRSLDPELLLRGRQCRQLAQLFCFDAPHGARLGRRGLFGAPLGVSIMQPGTSRASQLTSIRLARSCSATAMMPPGMALGPRSGAAKHVNFAIMSRTASNAPLPDDAHSSGSMRSGAPFLRKGVKCLACSARPGQNLR